MESLATKYRPKTWDDITEQTATKVILEGQLKRNEIYHGYLFCGGAGTGKTTSARIFANEINQGQGNPIEIDAASNSGVDNVRDIIKQAKMRAIDAKYKVFIIDECHSLSNTAWQALLKLLEEPPELSIFIFCTTDPQKIPGTILSRVQRYNFSRISLEGITKRLHYILKEEGYTFYYEDSVEYIARIADGGMRDAITMLDKCLSYDSTLSRQSVNEALGLIGEDEYLFISSTLLHGDIQDMLNSIEQTYQLGYDLKQYIYQYILYLLNIIRNAKDYDRRYLDILTMVIKVNSEIKWVTNPKAIIEAEFVAFRREQEEQSEQFYQQTGGD